MATTQRREGVYKDLMEIAWLKRIVKWRGLQFTLQAGGLIFFLGISYIGLFGTPIGSANLASTFTWLIWWTLIPVTMLVAGRGWCLVCPWIAPAEWLQRLSFWRKGKHTLSLNLRVPKFMRNFGLMLVLFLILHWTDSTLELAFRPESTVYIALALFALAMVVSLVFEKRSFCKYFCPIGAVIAPYSLVAPVELRNRDDEVCRHCKTKDCIKGNEKGYACPMMIHPYAIERNTYCVLCTECTKTCPNDNISINIRRPFDDIFAKGFGFVRGRAITASLSLIALVLLGIVPFHNLEMTSTFANLEQSVVQGSGIAEGVVRTIALVVMGAIGALLFFAVSSVAKWRARTSTYTGKHIFTWFALAFIPLTMSLHLAHNYFHVLEEGAVIIPNLSDPLGLGWNLFGTAGMSITVLPPNLIHLAQFVTVGLGVLSAGYCLLRLSLNMFDDRRQAYRTIVPMVVFLGVLATFYTWVLTIPMSMRF